MSLSPGTRLGPYEILSPLGAGGMGEVYCARDTKLGRDVAVKVLPTELAGSPDALPRFEREARAVAQLSHPNILAIYDFGRQGETAYAVMELLEGETLRARLEHGALPARKAVELAVQMAEGLAAAHEKGIVHRDLKPENVFVTAEGRAKLLDFGLAKVAGSVLASWGKTLTTPPEGATGPGVVMGTVGYMSPEQVRGEAADHRSDIFSFGAVLFEMLTGRRAFGRETAAESMTAILKEDPPEIAASGPGLSPALSRIVHHCLEKKPGERFQSARDIAFALKNLSSTSGSDASFMAPSASQHRRTTWRWATLAFVAGSSVVMGVWGWARLRHSERPRVTRLSILLPAGQVLTGSEGPAISHDGRSIAYVARDAAGVSHLYVRALDRFESSLVPDSEGAHSSFFSPDDSRIGFFARDKLLTGSLSGGAATAIADTSFQPGGATWGEDDTIVFAPSLITGLVRIPSSGGKPQQLTEPDGAAKGFVHTWPQFLPGGRGVLFTIWGGSDDVMGTALVSLKSGTLITHLLPGKWSSVYVRSGHILKSGRHGITATSFDPDDPQPTRAQTSVLDGVFYSTVSLHSWFSVSDSGTLVFVPGDPDLVTLAWVDREGRVTPIADKAASVTNATLSPDGTRVVLEDDGLWLVDLRRGTRIRLTQENEGVNSYSLWSRDSTRIIFGSARGGGDWDIYSVPAGGGPAKLVLGRMGSQVPLSEAPDGTLLFSDRSRGTAADLWTLSPDGKVAPFLVSPADKMGGQYSPDGRAVAYVSNETGREEVYIRGVARPDDTAVVSNDGGIGPRWSPDGKELLFRHGDAFMAVSVSTTGLLQVGNARKLFEIQAASGRTTNHPGYGVSPDGRSFFVLRLDPRAIPTQINVVLNWFEELNAKVPLR